MLKEEVGTATSDSAALTQLSAEEKGREEESTLLMVSLLSGRASHTVANRYV